MVSKSETQITKGSLSIVFLVVLVDMIGFGIIIPFLTYMVEHLSKPETSRGMWVAGLMAAYAFAIFLFSSFWGSLSDSIGRRPILMIGLTGNTVTFIIFGLSNSLWMALGARFLSGLFNANLPVARAYIADVSHPSEVAKRQGLLGVAFGLGFTIGPMLGGLLSRPADWSWTTLFTDTIFETYPYLLPCVASSVLSLAGLILAIFFLPESIASNLQTKSTNSSITGLLNKKLSETAELVNRPLIGPVLWSATIYWVGFTIMHVVFILFTMMPILEGGLGFDEVDNGLVFAFIGLSGIITQGFLIGPLTKRFGSTKLMGIGLLISGFGLASIPYVDSSFAWFGILIACALISLGNGLFTPSNMALLSNLSRLDERGLVMGVSESLRSMASLIGVLIGGWVWDITYDGEGFFSHHTAFRICGICALIGFIIFRFSDVWVKGNNIYDDNLIFENE